MQISRAERFAFFVAGTPIRVLTTSVVSTAAMIGLGVGAANMMKEPAPIETTISNLVNGECTDNTRYSIIGRASLIGTATTVSYDSVYDYDPVAGKFSVHFEHRTTATNTYSISDKTGNKMEFANAATAIDYWLPPQVSAPNYNGLDVRATGYTGTGAKDDGCRLVNYALAPIS